MTEPVLVAENLTRVFSSGGGEVVAVQDASLDVRAGELLVVRGPSGSGKTPCSTCSADSTAPARDACCSASATSPR